MQPVGCYDKPKLEQIKVGGSSKQGSCKATELAKRSGDRSPNGPRGREMEKEAAL